MRGVSLLAAGLCGLLGLALVGCAGSITSDGAGATDCGSQILEPGQVRACRLHDGDVPDGVGARQTDWRIQNALLDVIVRGDYAPLTRLSGAGGTVVAATPTGGADPVMELIPSLPGGWFMSVQIRAETQDGAASLVLNGVDEAGDARQLRYRLDADQAALQMDGADGFLLVPQVGAVAVGATVEASPPDGDVVIAAAGELLDSGGELAWTGADRVVIADRRTAYGSRWPDAVAVSGTAPGATWVEARAGSAVLARLPVDVDGRFSGEIPAEADGLVATAEGFADGVSIAPGPDLALSLGLAGSLRVRAIDQDGQDIAAVLERSGQSWAVPAGGATLPVGPGSADTWLWAGPAHEAIFRSDLEVADRVDLTGVLRAVGPRPDAVLAEIGIEDWPDAEVRQAASDRLAQAAGRGVGFAVLVADDEIAQDAVVDSHVAAAVALRVGSRAASDTAGSPLAWPSSADLDQPAQGAVPWQGLDAADLLAASRWGGQRMVVVDPAWLRALLAEGRLDQVDGAMALRLDELDALDDWLSVLDAGHDLAIVGPWTWVEGVDPGTYGAVDVESGLVAGRTIASTGPRIALQVDGKGPGSLLHQDTGEPSSTVSVSLRVETPAWAPIQQVSLLGRGGAVLWTLDVAPGPVPVEVSFDLDRSLSDWIVVVAEGDQASPLTGRLPWAVTSPVWIE